MKASKSFRDRVYALAEKIPRGKVLTYGGVARLAGAPRAGRAVGGLMRANPDMKKVPCHRVVGADGSLTGYAGGLAKKRAKLLAEGVRFTFGKVDLTKSLWT